jgi:hypothetical protein
MFLKITFKKNKKKHIKYNKKNRKLPFQVFYWLLQSVDYKFRLKFLAYGNGNIAVQIIAQIFLIAFVAILWIIFKQQTRQTIMLHCLFPVYRAFKL